ncbi:phosphatidate phosphatase LPIN2 [Lepeophtheirus salmonis]|uniref:phosphatidate phosphatase LPIN2 n=1 Tax=Lepeophtheirus salmonis TaxID=72036 RepID=UPI001AE34FFB|nr:phosphatidate phosphatase LPIN3-like [Lepeophtheirus salmonis]
MAPSHRTTVLLYLVVLMVSSVQSSSCDNSDYGSESLRSGGNDVILVRQSDGITLKSTPFQIQVGKFSNFFSFWQTREGKEVEIYVNEVKGPRSMFITDSGTACFRDNDDERWASEEWSQVPIKNGINYGRFHIPALSIDIYFKIYLHNQDDRLVIADVDGTITESDVKGHVYSVLGSSAHHHDVIPLFQSIYKRGYQIIYLTARSIAQDDETRNYLFKTLKKDGLPIGPLLMSPKPLSDAIIDSTLGSPRWTKAKTLLTLLKLFREGSGVVWGAYGNKKHDAEAYRDAGIPNSRIYLVNPKGELRREDGEGGRTSYTQQQSELEILYPSFSSSPHSSSLSSS